MCKVEQAAETGALSPELVPLLVDFPAVPVDLRNGIHEALSDKDDEKLTVASLFPSRGALLAQALLFFYDSGLVGLAEKTLGARVAVMLGSSIIRKHGSRLSLFNPWHQDAGFFEPEDGLTIWVPMEDVGIDRPSLTFVDGVDGVSMERSEGWFRGVWDRASKAGARSHDDAALHNWLGAFRSVDIQVSFGQCLVFRPFAFHRTQIITGARQARHSIDFRVVRLGAFPKAAGPQTYAVRGDRSGVDGFLLFKQDGRKAFRSTESLLAQAPF